MVLMEMIEKITHRELLFSKTDNPLSFFDFNRDIIRKTSDNAYQGFEYILVFVQHVLKFPRVVL